MYELMLQNNFRRSEDLLRYDPYYRELYTKRRKKDKGGRDGEKSERDFYNQYFYPGLLVSEEYPQGPPNTSNRAAQTNVKDLEEPRNVKTGRSDRFNPASDKVPSDQTPTSQRPRNIEEEEDEDDDEQLDQITPLQPRQPRQQPVTNENPPPYGPPNQSRPRYQPMERDSPPDDQSPEASPDNSTPNQMSNPRNNPAAEQGPSANRNEPNNGRANENAEPEENVKVIPRGMRPWDWSD